MRARLVLVILRLFSLLPLRSSHAIGAVLGWIAYLIPSSFRQVAVKNIQLCFPEWTEGQRNSLLKQCLIETGKTAAELGGLWLWPPQRVLALVKQVSGQDHVEQAMANGRGVILAAPHLGCWEILGPYCAARWPMTNLYRPPHLEGLEAIMRNCRERYGSKIVPTDAGGVRALYKALGRGELVGILPDQEPDNEGGVFAPFFDIPAFTMTLLSRLAYKSGARVLIAYAERLPRGQGYHLHFVSTPDAVASEDALKAAGSLNQSIEACVRDLPAQYQWPYKRFKTRPKGEKKLYQFS